MSDINGVAGVILAGGLARRMGGGDKCLLPLAGKTLLQRTIERAQPQVKQLLLNANGNSLRFARTRLPVVADVFPDHRGPLAGIHAALNWLAHHDADTEWLASFASDTPFFPVDVVAQLFAAAQSHQTRLVVAASGGRQHPTFALWHRSLIEQIAQQLQAPEVPRLLDWVNARAPITVEFELKAYDPFFNINTPQDLYAAEPMVDIVK